MSIPKTAGFPRMMKEPGELRVFLPEFISYLTTFGVDVFIEEGYGSRSGYTFDVYKQANEQIHMCSREEAFQKDVVIVLRSPRHEEMKMIPKGTVLISMLHFPTRPKRVKLLNDLGIKAISLDSIVSDNNLRMVENMKAVAWNGLDAAFFILENCWPKLQKPDSQPIHALVLGTGMVGKHAVDAVTKLGNLERNTQHMLEGGHGAVAISVGRNVSSNPVTLERLMRNTDILVDATQRRNPSAPVIPNDWIAWLPEHAVIADLSVDPYTLDAIPPVVRGVEGIPQGNLDKYIYYPNDSEWGKTIPAEIPSANRRVTVTCYSWPGIHPEASMRHYAQQMEPLVEPLFVKGYEALSLEGNYFERAIYRATLKAWMKSGSYKPRPR